MNRVPGLLAATLGTVLACGICASAARAAGPAGARGPSAAADASAAPKRPKAANRAASSLAAEPMAAHSEPADERAPHWLDVPAPAPPGAKSSPLAWAGVGAVVSLGAAAGVLKLKKDRSLGAHARHSERIELLAVRSLGGRQRLCLVEAAGERLLIAASEQEVTLISHLPSLAGDTAYADVAAPLLAAEVPPAAPEAPSPSLVPPPVAPASKARPAPLSPTPLYTARPPPLPYGSVLAPGMRAGVVAGRPPVPSTVRADMAPPLSAASHDRHAATRPLASADVEGLGRWRTQHVASGGVR